MTHSRKEAKNPKEAKKWRRKGRRRRENAKRREHGKHGKQHGADRKYSAVIEQPLGDGLEYETDLPELLQGEWRADEIGKEIVRR